jgi:hypothetical protein
MSDEIILPTELTPALEDALGMPNFVCGPIAEVFRKYGGKEIPRKSEKEQAFILHWAAGLAIRFGDKWRVEGDKILDAMKPKREGGE